MYAREGERAGNSPLNWPASTPRHSRHYKDLLLTVEFIVAVIKQCNIRFNFEGRISGVFSLPSTLNIHTDPVEPRRDTANMAV